MILIADRKVLSIPIHDNGERLVDLRQHPEIMLGPSPEVPNNQIILFARRGRQTTFKSSEALTPRAEILSVRGLSKFVASKEAV